MLTDKQKADRREYRRLRLIKEPDFEHKAYLRKKANGYHNTNEFKSQRQIINKRRYNLYRDRILRVDVIKRETVVIQLGGKCASCGYSEDIRALELDHKNSDGYLDRQRYGAKIARYYVNHLDEASERLQVLCANCNKIKAMDQKEHNRTRRVA